MSPLQIVIGIGVAAAAAMLIRVWSGALNVSAIEEESLALVERTYKQFPIAMDYVGLSVATTEAQHIVVEVIDGEVASAGMQ